MMLDDICPVCDDALDPAVHSAPGYEGVEYALCPTCGWQAEP